MFTDDEGEGESRSGGGGGVGGPASGGSDAANSGQELAPNDLAIPVTRQVVISGPSQWKHLISGVDTLDLGFYVTWNNASERVQESLAKGKKAAEGTKGILWDGPDGRKYLISASGRPPMYTYHLQAPDFHAYIARPDSKGEGPNVYVSIAAQALWLLGVRSAIAGVERFIDSIVGKINRMQVSRCDLCADFWIPGGLTLDFLRARRVSRSIVMSHHVSGDILETFYVGSTGAPVRMRIYDKSKEILAGHGDKLWFLDIWKWKECKDVWRVEFQLRRETLKELHIDSFDDLVKVSGGIWSYLTEDWFSLRLDDNANQSRRTIEPWWQVVQELRRDFGPQIDISRDRGGGQAPVEWYVSHGAGCLPAFAARLGIDDFDSALGFFGHEMGKYWGSKDFETRYREERIRLGFDDTQRGAAA